MTDWIVEYYKDTKGNEPTKNFINSLPANMQVKILRIIRMLRDYGALLKEPYTKQIKGKIRELRIKNSHGAIRVLYFTYTGRRFVLLHGFIKKTNKTPLKGKLK